MLLIYTPEFFADEHLPSCLGSQENSFVRYLIALQKKSVVDYRLIPLIDVEFSLHNKLN